MKFHPIPKKINDDQKLKILVPARFIPMLSKLSNIPEIIIDIAPNLFINEPVKKDGANIPTTCH